MPLLQTYRMRIGWCAKELYRGGSLSPSLFGQLINRLMVSEEVGKEETEFSGKNSVSTERGGARCAPYKEV